MFVELLRLRISSAQGHGPSFRPSVLPNKSSRSTPVAFAGFIGEKKKGTFRSPSRGSRRTTSRKHSHVTRQHCLTRRQALWRAASARSPQAICSSSRAARRVRPNTDSAEGSSQNQASQVITTVAGTSKEFVSSPEIVSVKPGVLVVGCKVSLLFTMARSCLCTSFLLPSSFSTFLAFVGSHFSWM